MLLGAALPELSTLPPPLPDLPPPPLPDLPPPPLPDLPPPPPFVPGRQSGDANAVPPVASLDPPKLSSAVELALAGAVTKRPLATEEASKPAAPAPKAAAPKPAAAVIVKGAVKPELPVAPPARTGKVHVLAGAPDGGRSESSGLRPVAEIAPSTAALVSAALAVGRVTPTSIASAPAAASTAPSPTPAVPEAAALSAPVPAPPAAAEPSGREPDAPVLKRDRRTHPLGWAIASGPAPSAQESPSLPPPAKPRPDESSSGMVDPQAIVEATSVTVQPGAPPPAGKSQLVTILLLALAAGLLILFVVMYGR